MNFILVFDVMPGVTVPLIGNFGGTVVLPLLVVAEATAGPHRTIMAAVILLMLIGMFWTPSFILSLPSVHEKGQENTIQQLDLFLLRNSCTGRASSILSPRFT